MAMFCSIVHRRTAMSATIAPSLASGALASPSPRGHDEPIERGGCTSGTRSAFHADAHERRRVGPALGQLDRKQHCSFGVVLRDDVAVNADYADRKGNLARGTRTSTRSATIFASSSRSMSLSSFRVSG
jgi:hypothetical protein